MFARLVSAIVCRGCKFFMMDFFFPQILFLHPRPFFKYPNGSVFSEKQVDENTLFFHVMFKKPKVVFREPLGPE